MKKRLTRGIVYVSLIMLALILVVFNSNILNEDDLIFSPKSKANLGGEIEEVKPSLKPEEVEIDGNIKEIVERFGSEKIIVYSLLSKDNLGRINEKKSYLGNFNFLPEQYINPTSARTIFKVHIPQMPCSGGVNLGLRGPDWYYLITDLIPGQIVPVDLDFLQGRPPIFDVSVSQSENGFPEEYYIDTCIMNKGFNNSNITNIPGNISIDFYFNLSTLKRVENNASSFINQTNTKLTISVASADSITYIFQILDVNLPGNGFWQTTSMYVSYDNSIKNFSNYVGTFDFGVSDYELPPRKQLVLDYSLTYPNVTVNRNTIKLTNLSLTNPFSKYYFTAYLSNDIWPASIIPPYLLVYNNIFSANNVKREHLFSIGFTNNTFEQGDFRLPGIGQILNITNLRDKAVIYPPSRLNLMVFRNYKPKDNTPVLVGYISNNDSFAVPPGNAVVPRYFPATSYPVGGNTSNYVFSYNLRKGYVQLTLPDGISIYSRDEAANWMILYDNETNMMVPQYRSSSFPPFPALVGNYSFYWDFAPGIMERDSLVLNGSFLFDGEKFKITS